MAEPKGGRRGRARGGRLLENDPGWIELLTSLSGKVGRVLDLTDRSIRGSARDAEMPPSALQKLLKLGTDPKLSTLYRFAKGRGYRVYVFFEAGPPVPPPERL